VPAAAFRPAAAPFALMMLRFHFHYFAIIFISLLLTIITLYFHYFHY